MSRFDSQRSTATESPIAALATILAHTGNVAGWQLLTPQARDEAISHLCKNGTIDEAMAVRLSQTLGSNLDILPNQTALKKILTEVKVRIDKATQTTASTDQKPTRKKLRRRAHPNKERYKRLFMMSPVHQAEKPSYLPENEVIDRFAKMGIDLLETHANYEQFYQDSGYANLVDPYYSLPLPQLTEKALNAFERANASGFLTHVMIDDGRLNPAQTVKLFQPSTHRTTREKIATTRRMDGHQLDDFLLQCYKKNAMYKQSQPEPDTVQLIGYSANKNDIPLHQATKLQIPHVKLGSTGTFMRLIHFLREQSHADYITFLRSFIGSKMKLPEVVLNSITADEQVVMAQMRSPKKEQLSKVSCYDPSRLLHRRGLPFIVIDSASR